MKQGDVHCPLCGYDYEQQKVLLNAIEVQSNNLHDQLDNHQKEIASLTKRAGEILCSLNISLIKDLEKIRLGYNEQLLNELERHLPKRDRLEKIAHRIKSLGVALPLEYATDYTTKTNQISGLSVSITICLITEI